MLTPLEYVERKIAKATAQLSKLQEERNEILRSTQIHCSVCSATHEIRDVVYIQTHWYESPHGCSGGDTWHEGEGQVDCPSCEARLRLYQHPELVKLKRLFKEIKDEYKN